MVLVEVREMTCIDLGGLSELELPTWRWQSEGPLVRDPLLTEVSERSLR